MRNRLKMTIAGIGIAVAAATTTQAAAPTLYVLTVTNGGAMPLSPMAIYTVNGQTPKARVGIPATPGFVQLCQTGNPTTRIQELAMSPDVTFKTQTSGMLMPGESRAIEIEVQDPLQQSIQFETMYGKTKDICAVSGVGSHGLYALQQHVTSAVLGKDDVLQTGAFLDPALPMGRTYLDPQVCSMASDAVSCLRSLALENPRQGKIRFFSGYLSSLTMLLESKYGTEQTLNLMIPSSGAVRFELRLKH